MMNNFAEKLERGRVRAGEFATSRADGGYGVFHVQGPCGEKLKIISGEAGDSISEGWEHVSVSTRRRCPNWIEMCFVKDLFWTDDECVIQFHPPRSEYVNNHPHCLHLWRPVDNHVRLPPSVLVGVKKEGVITYERALALRATV